jgi:hypothetical protein
MNTATRTDSPELPVIYAPSVLSAQGWRPTAADRAAITARADWMRELTGRTDRFPVTIMIKDTYGGANIGTVTFADQ